MKQGWARLGVMAAFLVVWALLAGGLGAGCGPRGHEQHSQQFHCPMHPTYVNDGPGDCPICGMKLVPVGPAGTNTPVPPPAPPHGKPGQYVCPMCPEVLSEGPAKCPTCGMDLVQVPVPLPEGRAEVTASAQGLALAGVQTAPAVAGDLRYSFRTVGLVKPDETRVKHIHTRTAGWVQKLFVNATGQLVKVGDPILALYSPELLAAQDQYLLSGGEVTGGELARVTKERLTLLGMPPQAIDQLAREGKVQRDVTLLAPVSGYITSKPVFEGQQVEPGSELYTVTDLDRVWVEAQVYENEAGLVQVGQEATVTLAWNEARRLQGKVDYIYPYMNQDARTLQVRLEFDNADLALRPGAFVDVDLWLEAKGGVIIPDSAVLDTGVQRLVYVDAGGGHFLPRQVKVGVRHGGQAQVLEGLAAGDAVAVKGNFLLDSESRIRAALPMTGETH